MSVTCWEIFIYLFIVSSSTTGIVYIQELNCVINRDTYTMCATKVLWGTMTEVCLTRCQQKESVGGFGSRAEEVSSQLGFESCDDVGINYLGWEAVPVRYHSALKVMLSLLFEKGLCMRKCERSVRSSRLFCGSFRVTLQESSIMQTNTIARKTWVETIVFVNP